MRWLKIGQVSFIPSLRYELTPVGPERQIRSYVKVGRQWRPLTYDGRSV